MALIPRLEFDLIYRAKEAELCNHALYRIGSEVMKSDDEDTKVSRVCKAVYAQTRDELLRNYPFAFATKRTYIVEDDAPVDPLGEYLYAFRTYDANSSFSGTRANLSATITSVTAGLDDTLVGRTISGTSIPAGARIVSVNETAHSMVIDRPCTGIASDAMTIRIPLLKIVSVATGGESLYATVNSGDRSRILCNFVSAQNTALDNILEIEYVEQVIDPDLFDPLFRDALVLRVASKIAMQLTSSPNVAQGLQAEFAAIMNLAKIASSEESVTEVPEDKWTTSSKG